MNKTTNDIINQLGGNKFIIRTGASIFSEGKNYVTFTILNAKNNIRYVKITYKLNTYDIQFYLRNGEKFKEKKDIYCNLKDIFTITTGYNY